jgi:hypothetical protein
MFYLRILFLALFFLKACTNPVPHTPVPRERGHSFFDDGKEFYLSKTLEAPKNDCARKLEPLSKKKSLDVRIVFGYKDTRPSRFVADLFEKAALVQQLINPCSPTNFLTCGMSRDEDDADLFIKNLSDGRSLRLTIISSSMGPDDKENRNHPLQVWQSRHAQQNFLQGLQLADAVFYIGHSRDGGGPDFEPPMIDRNGHVNYTAYTNNRSTFRRTLEALQKRPKQNALFLGMLSCSSSDHFSKDIKSQVPELILLSSRVLVYYSDALENALFSLNSFLRNDCEAEFKSALYTRSSRISGIKMEGRLKEILPSKPQKK